jgi:hypothetical protein
LRQKYTNKNKNDRIKQSGGNDMKKLIIEVGSTCTKLDEINDEEIKRIKDVTIEFKRHFNKTKKLDDNDVDKLINLVKEVESKYDNIFVCGTSIFRGLEQQMKEKFLTKFKAETGLDFHIISQEEENKYTVEGATRKVKGKVAVFIGGGGSTEIAIYDNGIKEMCNTKIGVIDVMEQYPDLGENLATTDVKTVREWVKTKLKIPTQKADVLILAGGGHMKFAKNSGITFEKNTLFEDKQEPIMMDINTRKLDTERYYKKISLDEIRSKVNDPEWWYATRAMCAMVLEVAESLDVKYIIPTDISMVYGLANK